MSWKCQIQRFSEQRVEGFDGITVGEVMELSCLGESQELTSREIEFVNPKDHPHDFKLLEVKELSPTGGKFLMTTYLAPQEEWTGVQLTDGAVSWDLEIEAEAVVSVLPQESMEPPMPFGPYGPFVLGWPMWLLLLILPVLLLMAIPLRAAWVYFRRHKELKDALSSKSMALKPMPAFHKAQRHIVKSLYAFRNGTEHERNQVITKMRESLYDYLLFEFHVILGEELSGRHEKTLKSQLKSSVASLLVKDLKMILTELKRAERDLNNVSVEQAQHLVELTRELVSKLDDSRKGKERASGVA